MERRGFLKRLPLLIAGAIGAATSTAKAETEPERKEVYVEFRVWSDEKNAWETSIFELNKNGRPEPR